MNEGVKMKKIGIIGSGFVGEAVGSGMRAKGFEVLMHDINTDRLEQLKNDGFETTPELKCVVSFADFLFVQVPTPSTKEGIDLACVDTVVADLKKLLNQESGKIIILKSTVLPGTTRKIAEELNGLADVCYCPEFLQESTAKKDFLEPDRVVIGGEECVTVKVAELFLSFGAPIFGMTFEEAEMVKYASNNWFSNNISYWNDIVKLCGKIGADAQAVHRGVMPGKFFGKHPWNIGSPFGGNCLVKDIRALLCFAREKEVSMNVLESVEKTNEEMGGHKYG